ncbi:MAG TPA: hypothetical protein VM901_00920 [Bdellovibrionota bacterium]|jgi:hypothetical protein|nr:hypothetical protein [Bdellovibrionota bacterium]
MRFSLVLVLTLLALNGVSAHAINFPPENEGSSGSVDSTPSATPYSEADARAEVSDAWRYTQVGHRIEPGLYESLDAQVKRFLTYVKTQEEAQIYIQLLTSQIVHRQVLSVDTLLDTLKTPSYLLTMRMLNFMSSRDWTFRLPEHGTSSAHRSYLARLNEIRPRSLESAFKHYLSQIRRIRDPLMEVAIAKASLQLPEGAEVYPLYGFLLEAAAQAQTNNFTREAFRLFVSEGMLLKNLNFMMPNWHIFQVRGISSHQNYGVFHLLPLLKHVSNQEQLTFFEAMLRFVDARHPQSMSRLDRFDNFDIAIFKAFANILPHVNDRTNVDGLITALWATERASDVATMYSYAKRADPDRFPTFKRCWNLLRNLGKSEKFQTPSAL